MLNKNQILDLEQYLNLNYKIEKLISHGFIERPLKSLLAESVSSVNIAEEDINEYIANNLEESFNYMLFKFIDDKNLVDSYVYKKAGVDRRLFSKIRSSKDYKPRKNTVIALALALELDINEVTKLLDTLGYTLSLSSKFDLVIKYCFEKNIYDCMDVNEALDYFGIEVLN